MRLSSGKETTVLLHVIASREQEGISVEMKHNSFNENKMIISPETTDEVVDGCVEIPLDVIQEPVSVFK